MSHRYVEGINKGRETVELFRQLSSHFKCDKNLSRLIIYVPICGIMRATSAAETRAANNRCQSLNESIGRNMSDVVRGFPSISSCDGFAFRRPNFAARGARLLFKRRLMRAGVRTGILFQLSLMSGVPQRRVVSFCVAVRRFLNKEIND